jgi:Flp pilus assembly CpaF family ATPase
MNLTETINLHKQELASIITQISTATNRKVYLENEIADLEYRMSSERINNPVACLVPTMLVSGNCNICKFENGCNYRFKGEGKRFKL